MKPRFFPSPAAFRAWLQKNHARATEVLVGFWKRSTGKPSLTWSESVDVALCFGWIDGVRRTLGPDSYVIRFTPRKPTSDWSAINVGKAKALLRAGRMTAAGRRAFESRNRDKTPYSSELKHQAAFTPAQRKKLESNRKACAYFTAKPPWYRRSAIHWVNSAKREATRSSRLATLIAYSARNQDIPPLARPPRASGRSGARRNACKHEGHLRQDAARLRRLRCSR